MSTHGIKPSARHGAEDMPRKPTTAPQGSKLRVTLTLEPANVEWMKAHVESGEFRSLSHAVDRAVAAMREQGERKR